MELSGLHLLLTYQCNFECDHCFVWGSPWQKGVFSLEGIRTVLQQAGEISTIRSIYFEGGEPFLYYPLLLQGVQQAANRGYQVGIVTNAYWATGLEEALQWLEPFSGLVSDLSVSSDLFHYSEQVSSQALLASQAAEQLGIPVGLISIAQPDDEDSTFATGQLPEGQSGVMHRGRAAVKLAEKAPHQPYESFSTCPYEDLRQPGRVHIDPFGNLHLCQGLVVGNLFETPLVDICAGYQPDDHAVVGPLLAGGPLALAQRYNLRVRPAYVDACEMCYEVRYQLRGRLPEILRPDQMYGIYG